MSFLPFLFAVFSLLKFTSTAIVGPVLQEIFADPTIIQVDAIYYAFGSRTGFAKQESLINIPIASSKSFQSGWRTIKGDALPFAGEWTVPTNAHVLTPDVNQLDDGSFIMYYIAVPEKSQGKMHCVGAATSKNVTGPYKPQNTALLCPIRESGEGTADPNGFTYQNARYIVFKNSSGHDAQRECYIAIEKVGSDGFTPQSKWTDLLNSTAADQNDVEGSALVRNPDTGGFVLFFTAGTFNTTNLRIEYATSDKLLGPYTRRGILLETGTYDGVKLAAPVGLDCLEDDVTKVVFEAFGPSGVPPRRLYTALLQYNGTKVSLA